MAALPRTPGHRIEPSLAVSAPAGDINGHPLHEDGGNAILGHVMAATRDASAVTMHLTGGDNTILT